MRKKEVIDFYDEGSRIATIKTICTSSNMRKFEREREKKRK